MEKRLNEEMEFGDAATLLPLLTGFYRSRLMAIDYIQSGQKDRLLNSFSMKLNDSLPSSTTRILSLIPKASILSHIQ